MPNNSLIKVNNLSKIFSRRKVLKDINFEVEKGDFLAIFGPNGVGKTTLIRILSTVLAPSSGTIIMDGVNLAKDPISIRRKVGVISHNPYLYPDLSAYENLRFYGKMYGISSLEDRISHFLELVELNHRKYDIVRTFSRGMQQRLTIARALLHEPSILFLDEPHSGLDPHAAFILDSLLEDLLKKNHTFVMTTHNLAKGLEMANSVMILKDGQIVFRKSKDQINPSQVKEIYFEYVGEAR